MTTVLAKHEPYGDGHLGDVADTMQHAGPSRQRLYRNEGGVWRTKTCKPDESEIAANIALGWHYWSNELWCHWNKKNDAGRLSKEEPES